MQHKKIRKMLACVLAGTMVLGMSATAFAAEGDAAGPVESKNTTGSGEFEGHVEKEKLLVQLPTVPEQNDTTFAYTMDPEGLIAATEGAKDKDASFEAGATVYFQSAEKTYTKESQKLKVVNKGTADADVTVKAETATNSAVTMATSSTFTGTDAELYLGLAVANKDAVAVKTTGDSTPATVTVGLKGAPDNFEVTYDDTTKKYAYTEKNGVAETAWNSFEFGLTGACNPKGDFSAENLAAPDVTVTWSYEAHADATELLAENAVSDAAPSISTTSYSLTADTPVEIAVSLGGGTLGASTISKVTDTSGSAVEKGAQWDFAGGKLTFTTARVNALLNAKVDKVYIVHFDDQAKTKINVTLKGSGK